MSEGCDDCNPHFSNDKELGDNCLRQKKGRRSVGGPKFCYICGEKAKSYNYGGISCHCCKSFFRHAILNKLNITYSCKFQGNCQINKATRKKCKKCRFVKCLQSGMEPSWVLTEKSDPKYLDQPENSDSTKDGNPSQECQHTEAEKRDAAPNFPKTEFGFPLNEEDAAKISSLHANYRKVCADISYDFAQRKSKLIPMDREEAYSIAIGIFTTQVRRLVCFAKLLPEFGKLPKPDQENLIKLSTMQTIILRSTYNYNLATDTVFPLKEEDDYEHYPHFSMEEFNHIFPQPLWDIQTNFYRRVNEIERDESCIVLLIAIAVFQHVEYPIKLEDEESVMAAQGIYSGILQRFLLAKHGPVKGKEIFPRLLAQLVELREVADLYQFMELDMKEMKKMERILPQIQPNTANYQITNTNSSKPSIFEAAVDLVRQTNNSPNICSSSSGSTPSNSTRNLGIEESDLNELSDSSPIAFIESAPMVTVDKDSMF